MAQKLTASEELQLEFVKEFAERAKMAAPTSTSPSTSRVLAPSNELEKTTAGMVSSTASNPTSAQPASIASEVEHKTTTSYVFGPSAANILASIPKPPTYFKPFFTLIKDKVTGIEHPVQVKYIFSDDDPSAITNACLASAAIKKPVKQSSDSIDSSTKDVSSSEVVSTSDDTEISSRKKSKGKKRKNHRAKKSKKDDKGHDSAREEERDDTENSSELTTVPENRVLLLDVDITGSKVLKAQSLTPNWQILNTSLAPAPAWDEKSGEGVTGVGGTGNLMLTIEGTSGDVVSSESRLRPVSKQIERRGLGMGIEEGIEDENEHGEAEEHVSQQKFADLIKRFDTGMCDLLQITAQGEAAAEEIASRTEARA